MNFFLHFTSAVDINSTTIPSVRVKNSQITVKSALCPTQTFYKCSKAAKVNIFKIQKHYAQR